MKSAFRIGEWLVEPRADQLAGPDETIKIEPRVMQVLVYLAEHAGEVVTREEILEAVWEGTFVTDEVLTSAISKLRRAFGDEGADGGFIQTVPKKGYRLNASVSPVEELQEPASTRRGGRTALLATAGLLAACLALALGFNVGGLRDRVLGGASLKPIESIAVLPLHNLSGDPEQEYFVDGMTVALITDLSKIGALKVISRTSAMRYKETTKSLPEIARELGVDGIVEGSVLRSGQRVRITVQLIGAETDRNLWAEHYERDLRDILALQGEVARAIAGEIRIVVTPEEEKRLASTSTVNPDAHEAYLKGRYYLLKLTAEGRQKSLGYLQRAIELDPTYAPAYAALADYYMHLTVFGGLSPKEAASKRKAAALKALELDDTLAAAHFALARVSLFYEWDWVAAKKGYQRALQLSPSDVAGRQSYAHYLSAMGRNEEAVVEMERARRLDPLDLTLNLHLGWHLYWARRYDEANEQLEKTIELEPNWWDGHYHLGQVYEQKGMLEEAIAELQKAVSLSRSPVSLAGLGHAYGLAERKVKARKIALELEGESKQRYIPPALIAVVYAGLGERDSAFVWLEKALDERDRWLAYITVEPMYDPLRSDPRFQDLVRRMSFPES